MTPPANPEDLAPDGGGSSRGEQKLRDRYRYRMDQWRVEGYNVAGLEAVMNRSIDEIKEAFNNFRRAVYQLKDVEVELLLLDVSDFRQEADTLLAQLKDI